MQTPDQMLPPFRAQSMRFALRWGTTTAITQARSKKGRREINWDGGNPNLLDTTTPVNPFLVFLNTPGSQFKTPGLGLSQAPPLGGPQGGAGRALQ